MEKELLLIEQENNFKSIIDEVVEECGTDVGAIEKFKVLKNTNWRTIVENCIRNKLEFTRVQVKQCEVSYELQYYVHDNDNFHGYDVDEFYTYEDGFDETMGCWYCGVGNVRVTFSIWDRKVFNITTEKELLIEQEKNFKFMIDDAVRECGTDLGAIKKFRKNGNIRWLEIMRRCIWKKLKFTHIGAARGEVSYELHYTMYEKEEKDGYDWWLDDSYSNMSQWCYAGDGIMVSFSVLPLEIANNRSRCFGEEINEVQHM